MSCKDCLHYELCELHWLTSENACKRFFADKAEFVHLPCNAGQTLYLIVGDQKIGYSILQVTAWRIELDPLDFTKIKKFVVLIDTSYTEKTIDICEFGKSLFFTEEQAKEELSKRKKEHGTD